MEVNSSDLGRIQGTPPTWYIKSIFLSKVCTHCLLFMTLMEYNAYFLSNVVARNKIFKMKMPLKGLI